MPEDRSPSPVVNTEAIFQTSSWPFQKKQKIIPLHRQQRRVGSSHSEDQDHKGSIWRQGDSFSFYSASQRVLGKRAGPRTPCTHVHRLKGKSRHSECPGLFPCNFTCPQTFAHVFLLVAMQEATTRAYLAAWRVKSSRKIHWHGMWNPAGAGTFLHLWPWQPRYTAELLHEPTSLPSFYKGPR